MFYLLVKIHAHVYLGFQFCEYGQKRDHKLDLSINITILT